MSPSAKIGDRLLTAAQIGGVVATGWFVWVTAVLPRLGFRSLASIATEALLYVILAWLCGAFITLWVYVVVSTADLPQAAHFSIRSSAAAMWFAPAIVLLSIAVPAAFAVSVFLIANATRRLMSGWATVESPARRAEPESGGLPVPVLVASFAAQTGLVAKLWGHPLLAAILVGLSIAVLTALAITRGAYQPGKPAALPHSAMSVAWTFLLALAMTFGGISVRGRASATAAVAVPEQQVQAPAQENFGLGGDFPGVVLLPPLKPHTVVFVPARSSPVKFGVLLAKPIGIPFDGEYWLFRWPAKRPPPGAVIRRALPSELSFHTPDGWPMEMEARQKLDSPVSADCCGNVQIVVRNADPFPGTVSIELILADTTDSSSRPESLGSVPAGAASAESRVLNYRMPQNPALRSFNELRVVFHRALPRAANSAKIAIESFVLVP